MIKSMAVAGSLGAVAALTMVAPAEAATSTYAVQVKQRPAKIHGDGSVTVVFWLRCQAGFNAFEFSAGLTQGATFGGTSGGPSANLLPCDGTRHRVAVDVSPVSGSYHRGPADINVYVGIFDGGTGGDIAAEDSATVWLKR